MAIVHGRKLMHQGSVSLHVKATRLTLLAVFIWGCDKYESVPQDELLLLKPGLLDPTIRASQKKWSTMKAESEAFIDVEFGDSHLRVLQVSTDINGNSR